MCIDILENDETWEKQDYMIGYKIFKKEDNFLKGLYFTRGNGYTPGIRYYNENSYNNIGEYVKGYHAFSSPIDALAYTLNDENESVYKVILENITGYGYLSLVKINTKRTYFDRHLSKVYCGQIMTIIEEIKENKRYQNKIRVDIPEYCESVSTQ